MSSLEDAGRARAASSPAHVRAHDGLVTREERFRLLKTVGVTVWLTGLSGSGKSTIGCALEAELLRRGVHAFRLDGDNLRLGINSDLGFSPADRAENVRRVGEIARLFAESGSVAIVCAVSPFRADRDRARKLHDEVDGVPGPLRFIEVFVDTPLGVCEERDTKGFYGKARRGEILGFTGIDSPYEPPVAPECVLSGEVELTAAVETLMQVVGRSFANPFSDASG